MELVRNSLHFLHCGAWPKNVDGIITNDNFKFLRDKLNELQRAYTDEGKIDDVRALSMEVVTFCTEKRNELLARRRKEMRKARKEALEAEKKASTE
jgi:hypothetical protein